MASTGECGGTAVAPATAGMPKVGTRLSLGAAETTECSSQEGCEVPPRPDELEGPRSPLLPSPPPTAQASSGTFRRPPARGELAAAGARGPYCGLHCAATVRPRAPGCPPRGRGLRSRAPRGGGGGRLGRALSPAPRNGAGGGASMAVWEAAGRRSP